MRATTGNDKNGFRPIYLELESIEDVAKVYAVFNDLRILEALGLNGGGIASNIRAINGAAGNADFEARKWDKAISRVLKD